VTGLSATAADQLQVAARGITEASMASWKWMIEQQVRSQLQEVTPQNVKQRLDSLQDFFFQRNFGVQSMSQPIWDNTVKVELSAKQQELWKKETDARADFQDKAIASLVVAEFDRRYQLTADQWDKLEPVIAGVVHDYSPEISQIFSFSNGVRWFMGSGYTLLPFDGVPEADLKAILSKDQWTRWSGSEECGNAAGLWQNIQQRHNQRLGIRVNR